MTDGPKRREVYDFAVLDPSVITVEIRIVKTVYEIEDLVTWAEEQGDLPAEADSMINVTVVAMALDENGKKLGPVPIDTQSTGAAIVTFADLAEFAHEQLPGMIVNPEMLEGIRESLREMRERGERVG